jgi:S-adenosylmethionine:tRNA ribosyltransferase-isomerase
MDRPDKIIINKYSYPLPKDRIAQYPLSQRDQSKLLIYQNEIKEDRFFNLTQYLPNECMLVFNDTKVVQARLIFYKSTGAQIEILCLEPLEPKCDIREAFEAKSNVVWKCLIGNRKKWKSKSLQTQFSFDGKQESLVAERISDEGEFSHIRFFWSKKELSMSEVLDRAGKTPLPPYLDRKSEEEDKHRYQTIYAQNNGSVAAPTAGLHFTKELLNKIKQKNIEIKYITLHVGAGTFKPVKDRLIGKHIMHSEQIVIKKKLIEALLLKKSRKLVAVGTTTVRSLESIYWLGIKMIAYPDLDTYRLSQWDAYDLYKKQKSPTKPDVSLKAVLGYMKSKNIEEFRTTTQMLIAPEYKFQLIDGMLTNFHQPKSTLLLLIAAYLGKAWEEVYAHALKNDFRFLSYGDSCLFLSQ